MMDTDICSQVGWAQSRFENIRDQLRPFLTQTGFQPSNVSYIPVGATSGENLVERSNAVLNAWYEGRTLVEQLDALSVPPRALDAPLRIPVSNVFRGQTATSSGLAVAGRIESGIVQIGERLACLPGDESGVVRCEFIVSPIPVPTDIYGDDSARGRRSLCALGRRRRERDHLPLRNRSSPTLVRPSSLL